MRTVKCESWEEATHTFPIHTQENRLREFSKLKFDGTSLPSSFIAYCQATIDGVNVPSTSTTVMFDLFRYVLHVINIIFYCPECLASQTTTIMLL